MTSYKIHMVSATNKLRTLCGRNVSGLLRVVKNSDEDVLTNEVTCRRCSKIIANDLIDIRIPVTISKFCHSMQKDEIKEILSTDNVKNCIVENYSVMKFIALKMEKFEMIELNGNDEITLTVLGEVCKEYYYIRK